jgi:hypothetical protein
MSENPFEISDDVDDDEDHGAPKDNSSFAELRKAYNRAEKERRTFEKEVQELREFREAVTEEKREAALSTAFSEVGLNPAHAKLFKALNPQIEVDNISSEVVAQFAVDYALTAVSGETPQLEEKQPEGYKPVVTGTASPLAKYSAEEFQALAWDEKVAAIKSGRVEKETAPWRSQG